MTRRSPSGRHWRTETRPSPHSRMSWRTASTTWPLCCPGRVMRRGHGRRTPRRSRFARSCLTRIPMSFSSGKNWRRASTTWATCWLLRVTWPGPAAYDNALAIAKKLSEANPAVVAFQRELAMCHNNIGALLSQTGDPVGARDSFVRASRNPAEACGREPEKRRARAGRGDEPQ